MNKIFIILLNLLILCISLSANGQQENESLYVYPEMQKAIRNQTRTFHGVPGSAYWQNKSKYTISVNVIPKTGKVEGEEFITYFNNSPDTLSQIIIRTYPDFYKCASVKDYTISEVDCSSGMNISKVTIEGDSTFSFVKGGTNMYLTLSKKILPQANINLKVCWDYFLPKQTYIREGTFYGSSFFIAYWYPQIAVYDDCYGWDYFNYTGLQEFYNDFNDYDVTIKVPSRYLVWATGIWDNPNEVLQNEYCDRYLKGMISDTVVNVVDTADRLGHKIFRNELFNIFRFKATSVSDFSFAMSDTYIWDLISVYDRKNSKRIPVNLLYHPSKREFRRLANNAERVILYLSNQMPGIPFPDSKLSIFCGEGGMEYPMMINQAYINDYQAAEVLAHEISHSYFPFLVGTNERRYAWMDESFAQTLTNECELYIDTIKFKPQQTSTNLIKYINNFIGTSLESVPMDLSINQKGGSYYFSAYTRPALALTYAKEIVGDSVYKITLQEYINRWKFKHPLPYDFFYTFNEVSKKNLNWFWRPWFFERGYPDISIENVTKSRRNIIIFVKSLGQLPVPINMKCIFNDGTTLNVFRKADIWEKEKLQKIVIKRSTKKLIRIELETKLIPDVDLSNNFYNIK